MILSIERRFCCITRDDIKGTTLNRDCTQGSSKYAFAPLTSATLFPLWGTPRVGRTGGRRRRRGQGTEKITMNPKRSKFKFPSGSSLLCLRPNSGVVDPGGTSDPSQTRQTAGTTRVDGPSPSRRDASGQGTGSGVRVPGRPSRAAGFPSCPGHVRIPTPRDPPGRLRWWRQDFQGKGKSFSVVDGGD